MEKVKKHAGAKMTSQLRHNFQANQAVHEADDVTTANFQNQVNFMSFCGPKFLILFTAAGWSALPYSINFGLIQKVFSYSKSAPMIMFLGKTVGRSLEECTTRSTFPSSRPISSSFVKRLFSPILFRATSRIWLETVRNPKADIVSFELLYNLSSNLKVVGGMLADQHRMIV